MHSRSPEQHFNSIVTKGFSLLDARNKSMCNINLYSNYHWFGQVRIWAIERPDKRVFLHAPKSAQNCSDLTTLGSEANERRAINMSLKPQAT